MITLLVLLPTLAALFALFIKSSSRYLLLLISLVILVITLTFIPSFYNSGVSGFQFVHVIKVSGYSAKFGMDGISFIFILLTAFLTTLCVIANFNKSYSYLSLFLLLEGIVFGLFLSLDLISFYIFFEASLIPMFFIIGIWGSDNKIYAAFKFFLYTFAGSVAFLVAIVFICSHGDSVDVTELIGNLNMPLTEQKLLWFALFVAFAVKIPMVPFHTWLPDAHVQAPTGASVVLAGILIKMGAYGFLRIAIPLFPEVSQYYSHFIFIFSSVAVVYASLLALAQTDIKKVIAYSSIAHMGLVTAGIFSFNEQGVNGAIFQMFSHGLISGGLFLCVGVLYDRKHTRNIVDYRGLANVIPLYSLCFIVLSMASIGLPGTSGFIGEFLPIVGVFQSSAIYAAILASGIILGAAYMLWLCKRIIWGEVIDNVINMHDLNKIEKLSLFSLVALTILFGIQPQLIINFIGLPVHNLINLITN